MSEGKKYYISKSGHTLKRKNPIVTKDGTIYETDLSTTLKSHEYVDGKLITRTEGGFVFVTNIEDGTPRSFNKTTKDKSFTLSQLIGEGKTIDEEILSSETELLKNVKLSPSYDKLSDYCYYGSANAMLKVEIDDIIDKYPFGSEDKEVFFNNLSDFQKILLNRNTTPLYKATFKVPIETDEGIKYVYKSFIHPSNENGDLDVESTNYNIYLSSLIDITNLIDELYCDNLYRVMTHDTIKNFDFTYSKDDVEEYIIGGSKVNKVLRIYGRAFDDIKKYIDGIGTVNTITYNGKNNIPKEYFYDNLNLKGWVPYNIAEHFKSDIKTSEEGGNLNVGMGIEDVSYELLRRFIINSPNIFRAKGTKKAINKVFSLFGIKEEWYDIFEIYQPVSGYIGNVDLKKIAEQNYNVNNMEQSISDVDPHTFDIERDMFKGINIKAKYKCPVPECGCDEYYKTFELEDGEDGDYIYYATCIENGHKCKFNDNLVGIPYHSENTYENYFQQKGGWYRETGGFHEHIDGESQVTDIPYGNNPHIGNGKYDNGYDYVMSYANLFKRYETPGGENKEDVLGFEITQKRQLAVSDSDRDKIFTVLPKKGDDDIDTELNINLKNMLIVFDIGNIQDSYAGATKGDFELIKKLTLPYIEQIIPSTTIFDMILKSTDPIWSYLDSYCEMDENGSATGMKIVRYQDVNPYSEHGKEGREVKDTIEIGELTSIVKKKFGGDFKHEDVIIVGETPTGDEYTNYDNIFIFKGESDDCPVNVNPDWEIIVDLI